MGRGTRYPLHPQMNMPSVDQMGLLGAMAQIEAYDWSKPIGLQERVEMHRQRLEGQLLMRGETQNPRVFYEERIPPGSPEFTRRNETIEVNGGDPDPVGAPRRKAMAEFNLVDRRLLVRAENEKKSSQARHMRAEREIGVLRTQLRDEIKKGYEDEPILSPPVDFVTRLGNWLFFAVTYPVAMVALGIGEGIRVSKTIKFRRAILALVSLTAVHAFAWGLCWLQGF